MRRTIGYAVLAVATFFTVYAIIIACTAASVPFGVAKRVTQPDRIIFNYEHFHDLCAGIAAKDQQHADMLKQAQEFDKRMEGKNDPLGRNAEESARLHQDAQGIRLARQSDAATYNADSRKWTRNHFKGRSLPYRITNETPDCDGGK